MLFSQFFECPTNIVLISLFLFFSFLERFLPYSESSNIIIIFLYVLLSIWKIHSGRKPFF